MRPSSVFGTPFVNVVHRDVTTVTTSPTPERALEAGARAQPVSASVDATRARAFEPATVADAEGRIGVRGGSGD